MARARKADTGRPAGRTARQAAGRAAGRAGRPGRTGEGEGTFWIFGIHAVAAALANPRRRRHRLVVTPNAARRLGEAIATAAIEPEIAEARRFPAPLDPGSVHQGAALEVEPLDWPPLAELAAPTRAQPAPLVVLLDRVTDPHNVGAILRSAEVFGAAAVVAPRRHAAPETGALAKAASGALERQPYLRVPNLARAMEELAALGHALIGLDEAAETTIEAAFAPHRESPLAIVLGAEGGGLRARTRSLCTALARIESASAFASLNVSNAAAVALYAAARGRPRGAADGGR